MRTPGLERRAATPHRIDPDNYRIYLVVKYIGYLTIPVHVVYLPLCFALGLPLFGYYNVFSMVAWPVAMMLNRSGRHQPAIDLITIEIVGFTIMGVYLGWESGFQTLLMPLIAFVMLNYRLRTRTTVVEALALVALCVGLYRFSHGRELNVTSPAVIELILYLNIGIVFTALCIVSYYFREASITAERRMEALATTDPLTGLANRIKLWDALGEARSSSACCRTPSSRPDSLSASSCARPFETARVRFSGLELAVTITIGVAGLEPGERVEQCIKRADSALYRGKHSGRNRVVAADRARVDSRALGERSTA